MKQSSESTKNKDESAIDEKYIRQQCENLLKEAGVTSAPVNLEMLASFAGISRIDKADIREAGILIPQENGDLVVLIRDGDNSRRQNFTCGHEISHTFFPDYREKPQKRVDNEVGKYDSHNRTEYLCDYGASYLLMPDQLFKPEFKKRDFSVSSMTALSDVFDASLEAIAIRMVSQNPKKHAVVVWEEKYKPVEQRLEPQMSLPGLESARPEKKLRVKFGYGFEKGEHIPKHKSLQESENIISSAYADGTQREGEEDITFSSDLHLRCKVSVFPIPNSSRVISLLTKL